MNIDKGLSNGRVTAIVQDRLGFIWVGTKNGLNRYDGTSFKVFNKKNSSISSDDISALKIDSQGKLWIGTIGGGVSVYNPIKNSFTNYKSNLEDVKSISSDDVHTIIEDKNNRIWIGTENGLNLFNKKTKAFKTFIYQINNTLSLSHNSVWSIFEQKEDVFWIGTYGGGLNKFDFKTETFTRFSLDSKINFEFINAITSINKSELLIGTNGAGLLKFNIKDNTLTNFLKNSKYQDVSIIRTIQKDNTNNLWIGTDGSGVLKIQGNFHNKLVINQYKHDNRLQTALTNNTVNAIFEDNQSNIWIGTAWKGINILEKKSNDVLLFYSDIKGYDTSPILSVYKENEELWMGTDGKGLSVFNIDNKELKFYNKEHNSFIGGDFIQCIKPSIKNQYWIGTFANGLVLLDSKKKKVKQFKREANNDFSLPYNDVRSIVELPSSDLWVGTWGGGLSYFNVQEQKFTTFKHRKTNSKSLPSDNVLSILLNKDNTLWIATFGGGLSFFDPKTNQFTNYLVNKNNSNAIASNYIFSFIKDDKGNLWIGTKEGLSFFDIKTKVFKNFSIGNAINNNAVVGLIQDNEKNIWLSTIEGIYKYNIDLERIQAFSDREREFHIASVFKDKNGMLYFGGNRGVTSFNPKSIQEYNSEFPVVFTDFKLLNKSVHGSEESVIKNHISYQDSITLTYSQRVFTFSFSSLQYPFSNNTQFAVKMEGFEDAWREIGTQNTSTFTNLSPGEYKFKVKSKEQNGMWNVGNIANIHINILPPYWRTWWAYVLYSILLVIVLALFQRYYLRWSQMKNRLVLEKLQREHEDKLHKAKQRFFTNISHEIRTPLTLILGPLNNLLKSDLEVNKKNQLSTIKSNTNRLLHLVNELLNFRKLEEGHVKLKVTQSNIVDFTNEIFLNFSQQAIIKKIDYQFKKTDSDIKAWFDKDQLEKVIFNLLSNAFKFCEEGNQIKIKVTKDSKYVNIIVSDSGQGIQKDKLQNIFERFYQKEDDTNEAKGFGIGLSIAKDIIELHSGKIEVNSKLGKGSVFTIKLPLGYMHFKEAEIIKGVHEDENIENYVADRSDVEVDEDSKRESKSSILLVEDNTNLRDYLKGVLSKSYLVIEASNGKEGLEMAVEFIPDLVVSDIMMPVMDGVAFCSKLKNDIRTSHIPVILLTARTLISDKIEGLETGADDYLTKPFNEAILKIRIKNLLQTRELLRDRYLKEGLLRPKNVALNSPDEEFLTKLVTIVEENIEESEFNVDQLAKDIGMSHSNVYKKIKAMTGMTIIGFVRDFRLQRAAQLLKEQQKISITDVCFKVGYTDRRHFSQEFKKKFGKSPSLFVKDHFSE
ncbi:hybrid sensor histidine kinase/response regulator transcription factor [Flavivirga spongiicola]|uniref:histidine kinase n=1 Tax=Flavivirga spongiicola TaxID=421621 RepID=A0ABU7XYT7_9FLAO|nr:two-component regulator propeller domain-containing protein [Flavivirga sp. MEBiC05379]MDO5980952.1 two-component regulator propeller domain-containing protein [Flavivirga sp. MEBiC05379]